MSPADDGFYTLGGCPTARPRGFYFGGGTSQLVRDGSALAVITL